MTDSARSCGSPSEEDGIMMDTMITDSQATAWVDQRDVQAYCPEQPAHWCANFIDDNAAEIEDVMHAAAAQFIKMKGQEKKND